MTWYSEIEVSVNATRVLKNLKLFLKKNYTNHVFCRNYFLWLNYIRQLEEVCAYPSCKAVTGRKQLCLPLLTHNVN